MQHQMLRAQQGQLAVRRSAVLPPGAQRRLHNAWALRLRTHHAVPGCSAAGGNFGPAAAPGHPDWPSQRYQGLRDEDVLALESFLRVFRERPGARGLHAAAAAVSACRF
jgi:hypothetical protein